MTTKTAAQLIRELDEARTVLRLMVEQGYGPITRRMQKRLIGQLETQFRAKYGA